MDTSAILAVLLDEPERPQLIAFTEGYTLLAPASITWEVGNAVVSLLRRRRLSLEQGDAVVQAFEKIPLRLMDVDLRSAIRIADSLSIYAYDAYLLEAAQKRGCPLVTLDKALMRAADELGVETAEIHQ